MKLLQVLLLLFAATSLRSQQVALTAAQNQAFKNYLISSALSCGQSVLSTKVLTSKTADCGFALVTEDHQPAPLADNQQAHEKAQDDLWQTKKQAFFTALKQEAPKLLVMIAVYALLTFGIDKMPQSTLYQTSSVKEFVVAYGIPYLIAKALAKGFNRWCPPRMQAARITPWIVLLGATIINYLATVKIYTYLQPYTMPTINQHLFNFTGNYLAPNICCQLVV